MDVVNNIKTKAWPGSQTRVWQLTLLYVVKTQSSVWESLPSGRHEKSRLFRFKPRSTRTITTCICVWPLTDLFWWPVESGSHIDGICETTTDDTHHELFLRQQGDKQLMWLLLLFTCWSCNVQGSWCEEQTSSPGESWSQTGCPGKTETETTQRLVLVWVQRVQPAAAAVIYCQHWVWTDTDRPTDRLTDFTEW